MRKETNEAHGLLVLTFGVYIAFQWLSPQLPFMTEVLHVVIGQLLLVLPGICWMRLQYKGSRFEERLRFKPLSGGDVKMAVCVLICMYPVIVGLNIFSMLFVKNAMSTVMSSMTQLGLLPMLLIMALMPAFNEEFLCRGLLYGAYAPVSKWRGVFLSAWIFGLLHLNLNQMPYAFFVGIVFALMVEATDSIYVSMLMHFLLNGFNVVLNVIVSRMPADTGEGQAAADGAAEAAAAAEIPTAALSGIEWRYLLMSAAVMLLFLILTLILVVKTFRDNGRSMKMQKDGGPGEVQHSEERLLDPWVAAFMVFALILTYFNTDFL